MRPTLLLLAAFAAGCASPEPTPAGVVPFASVCDEANEGERVGVRGYLRLPDSNSGDYSVMMRLFEGADFTGQPIGVSVRFGPGPHQIETLPTSYTDEDMRVRLVDGSIANHGVRVTVSGKVYYPLVDADFECGLENPFLSAGDA